MLNAVRAELQKLVEEIQGFVGEVLSQTEDFQAQIDTMGAPALEQWDAAVAEAKAVGGEVKNQVGVVETEIDSLL